MVRNFKRQPLEMAPAAGGKLRRDGVYLITGGLGGIGLAIASHLATMGGEATSGGARLVLVGRSALPQREQWDRIVEETCEDRGVGYKIARVRALEERGAELLLLAADVADGEQMQAVIRRTLDRFGTLHGVFHAAGVPAVGLMQRKTAADLATVTAPKVQGTLVLQEVLRNLPARSGEESCWLVLFSSINAMTGGGPGQVAYCTANAFLDAFACAVSTPQRPVVSISWGEWRWNAWEEGMAGLPDEARRYFNATRERLGIDFEGGMEALERALASGLPHVVVSTVDFPAMLEMSRDHTVEDLLERVRLHRVKVASGKHPRPELAAAYVPASGGLERRIAEIWQRVLGIEQVGVFDNFFDLGGNSLIGLQITAELERELEQEVLPLALYEAPTVNALARYLRPPSRAPEPRLEKRREARERRRRRRSEVPRREIALIGMSGRFPRADGVEEMWQNLLAGRESITFFSDDELAAAGLGAGELNNPRYVKAGAVLNDIERFDAALFGYSPREAELMDPQHRLFLECAWEALEDGGYDSERYPGSVGVFGGSNQSTYLLNLLSDPDLRQSLDPLQVGLGTANDSLTTRVSYQLNLRGPSIAVQTFCSTSAVAVHMACESLIHGGCDMALAGGVRVVVPHRVGYLHEPGGITSPDGHTRSFDAGARGAVLGNGVAIVLLKRLEEALEDGDHVYAVIRGSAINNDGSAKVGYTAPSVDALAEVIIEALEEADVAPESISYVEAHGTATELGDPIEMAALTRAFRTANQEKQFCAIGSVKSNLGHLDRAAGTTSLIKTALAVERGVLPASLHFEQANPKLDLANSPFYVQTERRAWEGNGAPRRAAVNVLGIGGTNVHFILEQAPSPEVPSASRAWQLLVLSAHTESALEKMTDRLAHHLERQPGIELPDVAATLQLGRRILSHRRTLVCRTAEDAVSGLVSRDPELVASRFQRPGERPVVFLFPELGDHYFGMAAELYRLEPSFGEVVDRCVELLRPYLELDLREAIWGDVAATGGGDDTDSARRRLAETWLAQPALFVVEYALGRQFIEWGLRPQALAGYGLGEYVAACLAGVFSLEDALQVVARRARLLHELPAATAAEACHSTISDPLCESFAQLVGSLPLRPPEIPCLSAVTGTWIRPEQATDPAYWVRHLGATVRFADTVNELASEPERLLLELGPGQTLASLVKQHPAVCREQVVLAALRPESLRLSDQQFLLTTLGRLYLAGAAIDWQGFYRHERRRRVSLPCYPFEGERYWLGPRSARLGPASAEVSGKKPDVADWFYRPVWDEAPPAISTPLSFPPADYLILLDRCGVGRRMVEALSTEVRSLTTIEIGEGFEQRGESSYVLHPGRPDELSALLEELSGRWRSPAVVLHLWGLTPPGELNTTELLDVGFYSLLHLARALGQVRTRASVLVISNGVQEVDGDEPLEAAKATLLAPCKVLIQEYPKLSCRSIDVVLPAAGGERQALAENLLAELGAGSCDQLEVAWRGGRRRCRHFVPERVETPDPAASALRREGVYLITGGLGGVGLVLAEALARSHRARLVLVGRTGLPERACWDEHLARCDSDGDDALCRKIRKVRQIEKLGAEVLVTSADVAEEEQMRRAVALAERRFGALDGVIHGAGIGGGEAFDPIAQLTREQCELHFQPKVHGLLVLEKVLAGKPLDFCLLLSSLSVVLGGIRLAGYAAANAFMDAFVRQHNRHSSVPWSSVNWDSWQLEEQSAERHRGLEATVAEFAMTPEEGAEAFRRILVRGGRRHWVHSTGSLAARIDQWLLELYAPAAAGCSAPVLHARPDLQIAYLAPATGLERSIAGVFSEILGIREVGTKDDYFDLGSNSLILLQVRMRLEDQLGCRVELEDFFTHPTVSEMAHHLGGRLRHSDPPPAALRPARIPPLVALPRDHTCRRGFPRRGTNGEFPRRGTGDKFPLSFAQQRIWFLYRLDPESAAYNLFEASRIRGPLRPSLLRRTLAGLLQRHETLRTCFSEVEEGPERGTPVQIVLPVPALQDLPLAWTDLSRLTGERRERELLRLAGEEAHVRFDLSQGELLRIRLVQLAEAEFGIFYTIHHIASDGWSMGILMRELKTLYARFPEAETGQSAGAEFAGADLPELPIQYADFAVWQRRWLRGEVLEEQLAWWRQRLAGASPLELPADRPRPPVQSFRGARRTFLLPAELRDDLLSLGRPTATLFMVLLAGFKALLHRYTGQYDLCVGTSVANRSHAEVENLVGFFVNTLVLRTEVESSGEPGFRDFLSQVRTMALEAYEHQDLPFERLVDELSMQRDLSRSPLFQVMFELQTTALEDLQLPGMESDRIAVEWRSSQFDLGLSMKEVADGIEGELEHSTDLFDAVTIERLSRHYTTLLGGIVADPERRLGELPLQTREERHQLLVEWNDTGSSSGAASFLVLFEAQVARVPESVAVVCEAEALTYAELDARANRAAHALRRQGVGPEDVTALLAHRSPEFLTAVLAIWKAGGTYLPLDPEHPASRTAQVLGRARPALVLVAAALAAGMAAAGASLTAPPPLRILEDLLAEQTPDNPPQRRSDPDYLAYVIFTSGSTGRPKGAMVTHRGMLNHLRRKIRDLDLRASDVIAQTASQCFDISVWQFLSGLLLGGRIRIVASDVVRDPACLLDAVAASGVSVLEAVPSLIRFLLEEISRRAAEQPEPRQLTALRWLVPTGEALPPDLCRQWFQLCPRIPLVNAYGPTECSDDVTHQVLTAGPRPHQRSVPIGRPLGNLEIYVLDAGLRPLPMGIPGELCVGGEGVGRGYLNEPRRTAEVFVPAPFSREPGARMYRTGDLGRHLADGSLEFLGRLDHQVKIHGLRIELQEIEAVLRQHPGVQAGGVAVRQDRLVAYVVTRSAPSHDALGEYLEARLPRYMVPAVFVEIEELPLLPNGKLDRGELRRRPLRESDRMKLRERGEYVRPRTRLELELVRIWEELLDSHPIGVRDDFFALGGNSFLALQLMARIRARLGRELPLARLFDASSIAALALLLEKEPPDAPSSPLVPLRSPAAGEADPSRPPLFFVHPSHGGVLVYRELAERLGSEQPFYGLQAPGLEPGGWARQPGSVQEMARLYLDAVRTVWPQGPYRLGGWSFGGLVAFEMARQLTEGGQEVAVLALVDTTAPIGIGNADDISELGGHLWDEILEVSEEELRSLGWEGAIARVVELALAADVIPPGGEGMIERIADVARICGRAADRYVPGPYRGRLSLLCAGERESPPEPVPRVLRRRERGWQAYVAPGASVEVYEVPGNHQTMIREHAAELAAALGRVLSRA
ncbi:MAG: amino acid adenylation domain-containing protein [bacterium]|nr:amino acid adenylation domain-containing protein [bacterium]